MKIATDFQNMMQFSKEIQIKRSGIKNISENSIAGWPNQVEKLREKEDKQTNLNEFAENQPDS